LDIARRRLATIMPVIRGNIRVRRQARDRGDGVGLLELSGPSPTRRGQRESTAQQDEPAAANGFEEPASPEIGHNAYSITKPSIAGARFLSRTSSRGISIPRDPHAPRCAGKDSRKSGYEKGFSYQRWAANEARAVPGLWHRLSGVAI